MGVAGEEAVNGEADWWRKADPAQRCRGLQQRVPGGDNVIHEDRSPALGEGEIGELDRHLAVAEPGLVEHRIGDARAARHVLDPLPALGVRSQHQGVVDLLGDPRGEEGGGGERSGWRGEDLAQRVDAVKVRVDSQDRIEQP